MKKMYYLLTMMALVTFCMEVVGQSVVKPLPYQEDFDNYDPSQVKLPEGWTFEGNDAFKIGAYNSAWVEPYSAPYYIVVGHNVSSYPRKDWLFTNGFNMQEGKSYSVNFWIYAPGYTNPVSYSESIKITAGTAPSSESQAVVLEDFRSTKFTEWTLIEAKFVAPSTNVYYIGINVYTEIESNGIGIDNFEVYSEDEPFEVKPYYIARGGYWSANTSDIKQELRYIYADEDIEFINQSRYATGYNWNTFGIPAASTEENITVRYTESGNYQPALTASNKVGSKTYTDVMNVKIVGGDEEVTALISNQDKFDGFGMRSPGDLFDNGYEFICGINRYYNVYAEKFDIPSDAKVSISSVSLLLWNYKVATRDRTKTVTVKVYGDAGGVPDSDNVFGSYTTTMANAFGTASIVEEKVAKTITFDNPIVATGTFYIAIEVDPTLTAYSATLLGTLCFMKSDKDTKGFVYIPEKDTKPEPELNLFEGWYSIDELPYPLDDIGSLSFYFAPRLTFLKRNSSSIEKTDQYKIDVYPTVCDDIINVDAEGEIINKVVLYGLDGKKAGEIIVNDTKAVIPVSGLNSGIYFVEISGKTVNATVKVIKR